MLGNYYIGTESFVGKNDDEEIIATNANKNMNELPLKPFSLPLNNYLTLFEVSLLQVLFSLFLLEHLYVSKSKNDNVK